MARCSQPGCAVATTGVCLKGNEEDCPYIIPDETAAEDVPPVASIDRDVEDSPPDRVFHSGEKLTVSEASRLLNDRAAIVVFCAGGSRSGKTTFLSRIGEMFRAGAFANYRFARSRTLCGHERVTWQATITSETQHPDTPRTLRIENDTFFHLRVHCGGDATRDVDVLLSDLAGETFPVAVGSKDFCAELRALQRADHVVVFLDAAQLADPSKRQAERNNTREFLQRVLAVKQHAKELQVHVIFSRWDYITRRADRNAHERFCGVIEQNLKERFGGSFGELNFFRVAARPDEGVPTDDQIQSIFAQWVETPMRPVGAITVRIARPARDFSAFGLQ